MEFVFTAWYFVILVLVLGIAACLVVFFMMDKKDKALINDFVKQSQEAVKEGEASSSANANEVADTTATEETK